VAGRARSGVPGPSCGPRLRSARAGASFAAALRAAGATGAMTAEQRAAGNEAVLQRLVAAGVPRAQIVSVAGTALAPAPLDVLAALGRKLG
jgi:hypothetical protein